MDFPRKRVVLIRRIATENIAEFEGFGVNFAIRAVDDLQPQCIVVISRPGVDELQFYPQFVVDSTEERLAAVLRVTDDVAAAEQLFEIYRGAVRVKMRQANRMQGAANSN